MNVLWPFTPTILIQNPYMVFCNRFRTEPINISGCHVDSPGMSLSSR